ncbi:MAG: amidohydrolase family protein [Oscillibacter sp.]
MRTLLKGADILLRKENGYETLHGAYLGVDEAKIDYIGEEKPEKTYDLEKDMSGRLLAPGLINCHSHIAMTLMRGIGSGLPLQDWLFKAIFPIEDKLVREDIAAASRFALIRDDRGRHDELFRYVLFPEETVWAVGRGGDQGEPEPLCAVL